MNLLSFVIIICSYNNQNWVEKNLQSVFQLTNTNYRIIYINDNSQDATDQLVTQKKEESPVNFIYINNQKRKYKLANLYFAIHHLCKDNEIIVELDGDDWFLTNNVLQQLEKQYITSTLITYGGFTCFAKSFSYLTVKPVKTFDAIRKECDTHFNFIALRSYYCWLFKKIKYDDLVDSNGYFFKTCSDVATMIPMLEMAYNYTRQNKNNLYCYNVGTGANDFTIAHKNQLEVLKQIKQKPAYSPLDDQTITQFLK